MHTVQEKARDVLHTVQCEGMATVKYFFRDIELPNRVEYMPNAEFAARFPGEKGIAVDSFKKLVAYAADWSGPYPVQRKITYKSFPSRHECNARCMNGRHDGACECQCGGRNHGLGAILQLAN